MAILHILWAVLNVAVLLGWLIFLRFLAMRFGRLALFSFVLVTVAMCQSTTKRQREEPEAGTFQTTIFLPNPSDYKPTIRPIKLANFTTFKLRQDMTVLPKLDSVQIKLSPSYATGFVLGISWVPANTRAWVDRTRNRVHYQTSGFLEWQVPGLLVYRQARYFDGYLPL